MLYLLKHVYYKLKATENQAAAFLAACVKLI